MESIPSHQLGAQEDPRGHSGVDVAPIQALLSHCVQQRCREWGGPPTHGSVAAHQGFLLLPQPLVIFHHLLLLPVQDLPHLEPLGLPQLLGLLSAAGSDEVLFLRGQRGERRGHNEPSAQTQAVGLNSLWEPQALASLAAFLLARFVLKSTAMYAPSYWCHVKPESTALNLHRI